jgi:hypothetical protein
MTSDTGRSDELQEDGYVARMVREPGGARDIRMRLVGFLGRDTEEGYWRVYLNPQLDTYVKVAAADVEDHQPDESGGPGMGRTVLFVRGDADVQHVTTVPKLVQASFLGGDITGRFMGGGSSAGLAGAPGAAGLFSTPICSIISVSIIVTSVITAATPGCPKPTSADKSDISCCLCTFRGTDC